VRQNFWESEGVPAGVRHQQPLHRLS
jgi:hypothetical protein